MKALVLTDKNKALTLQEVPNPHAAAGEAIVRVQAAALNHRDVWIQKGQYAGLKYPIIPGSDGAGVVVEVGAAGGRDGTTKTGDDSAGGVGTGNASASIADSWVGKEVIINPAINWGSNPAFQDPDHFRILGLPDNGTLAAFVKVPLENLIEKPSHLSFEEAAALPLAGCTAFRAVMTRARLQAGEKILITGIGGGVALFALQYAVAAGARVWVTSGSQEKIQKAVNMGAVGGVNYKDTDWVDALRKQAGAFDVTIDGTAGDGLGDLMDLSVPGGRVVLYGATKGNPAQLVARRIFWKQLNILGSTMGSPEDFRSMVDFVQKHSLRPVVDRVFPFQEGEAAFRWMDDAKQFGKIVVRVT